MAFVLIEGHQPFRAAMMETELTDLLLHGAPLFRELTALCDRKIELFKLLDARCPELRSTEFKERALEAEHFPWEELE